MLIIDAIVFSIENYVQHTVIDFGSHDAQP
jgi:hypothetical protein